MMECCWEADRGRGCFGAGEGMVKEMGKESSGTGQNICQLIPGPDRKAVAAAKKSAGSSSFKKDEAACCAR